MSDVLLKRELVELTTELYHAGIITASGGNVSVRSSEVKNALWITPSSLFKGALKSDDLVLIDTHGRTLSGRYQPSIEYGFHSGLMRTRKDINAIVHGHPPFSILWGLADLPVPPVTYDSLLVAAYPFIPWYMVGSQELADAIIEALSASKINGAFLRNHGLVTVGRNLRMAADATLNVEHTLRILHLARQIGIEPALLDTRSIQKLSVLAAERGS